MAARRKADELILAGQVQVNGAVGRPGQPVTPGVDRVTVFGRLVNLPERHHYLLLNKPAGLLTTVKDDRGRPTVLDRLPDHPGRLFPVGRLDLNSRGLLLLTDDGELAMRLTHPRYHVDKEYRVVVDGRPSDGDLDRLREGMRVGAERFGPATVRLLSSDGSRTRVTLVLREGRKREVRRMFRALGHPVIDLVRLRIGPLRLGTLAEGQARELTAVEVTRLRDAVGLGRPS